MKKSVILAILGLSATAAYTYAQGDIAFNTYGAMGGAGILTTYGNGPLVGSNGNNGPDSSFTGVLLWSATNPNDVATTAGTANDPLNPIWQVASSAKFDTGAAGGAGGFGYVAGPNYHFGSGGTLYYFEVAAFNGVSYGAGTYAGHSASFSATLAVAPAFPTADQINNMAPFSVFQLTAVPEPTTMALGGLGLASLLLFRRKQA
jgi:hypothetical protein